MAGPGLGTVGLDASRSNAEFGGPRPASIGAMSFGASVETQCEKHDREIEAPIGVSLGLPPCTPFLM